MKKFFKIIMPILFLSSLMTACDQKSSQPLTKQMRETKKSYEGIWKVQDSEGKDYYIKISPSGRAKIIHKNGEMAKWSFQDDAIIITSPDGWKTKLYRYRNIYKMRTYAPSTPLSGRSTTSSIAEKVDSIPKK